MTVHRSFFNKNTGTFVYLIKSYCILKIGQDSEKILYILQYHFNQRNDASKACEKICGENGLSKSASCKWFVCFHPGNFDFKDTLVDQSLEKVYEILQKI